MTKHYMKELSELPVYINGYPLRFEILETSDPTLIGELDNCVRRQVGGVIAITKEKYDEELKKKANGIQSKGSLKPKHSRQELVALRLADQARAAEVVANPANRAGVFAGKQQREASWTSGPKAPLPDPIEIPSASDFTVKPPPTMRTADIG